MCESVIASIASQEMHHRKMTFEEEFRTLQQKDGTPFNEQSAWDAVLLQGVRVIGKTGRKRTAMMAVADAAMKLLG